MQRSAIAASLGSLGLAAAALAIGSAASAQGITVFGDARLGLGYNTLQNGILTTGATTDGEDNPLPLGEIKGEDEVRVISRVRFGVRMSGETAGGVAFGGTIRADNAERGTEGTRGSVFVSGPMGTLTAGDTFGADGFRVGEVASIGMTGFGEFERPRFLSNAGNFDWDTQSYLGTDDRRPTLRYDYDTEWFGMSLSSNRRLKDVVVGASAARTFGWAELTVGLGYGRIEEYVSAAGLTIPANDHFSGSLRATVGAFDLRSVFTYADARGRSDSEMKSVVASVSYTFGGVVLTGLYHGIQKASGPEDFAFVNGSDAFGAGFSYALGGGARLAGGYLRDFAENDKMDFGIDIVF